MRINDRTIPEWFVKLDTHVNEQAAFANARDLSVLRQNHNILLGRRAKHALYTHLCFEKDLTGQEVVTVAPMALPFGRPVTVHQGDTLVQVPLVVSTGTQYLRLTVRAYSHEPEEEADDNWNVFLYPCLHKLGQLPWISPTTKIEVEMGDDTDMEAPPEYNKYQVDIPVPMYAQQGPDHSWVLTIFVGGGTDGAEGAAAVNLDGPASDNYVRATTLKGITTDNVVLFTDTAVEPRRVAIYTQGGGVGVQDKVQFQDQPYRWLPTDATADQASVAVAKKLYLWSMCVYEKAITDLGHPDQPDVTTAW